MRVSVFTLVVLLVPYLPAAALICGIAPRTRLFSTRPRALTAELARPAAFRAPQPTLSAAKAAEPAKTSEPTKPSEPAKPRKATLSEWGTLLRLCSQARHAKLHRHHTPRLTISYTVRPLHTLHCVSYSLLLTSSQDKLLVAFAFVMLVLASAGDVMLPQLQARALNLAPSPLTLTTHHPPLNLHSNPHPHPHPNQARALNLVLVGSTPRSAQVLALQHLAGMGVATAFFTGLRGFAFWLCGANLVRRLRAKLFGSLVRLPQSFHDERSTGELASRLQSDCIKLGDVLSLNVNIVLRQLLQARQQHQP